MNAKDTELYESICRFITDDDEREILEEQLQDVICNYSSEYEKDVPLLDKTNPWEAFVFTHTNNSEFWYGIAAVYDRFIYKHANGDEE